MSEYECIHTQTQVDRSVARLAAARHGAFSRFEALSLGATPSMINRRVANGRWEALYRGVYRLAGAPPTWRQSLVAACLAWNGVASHRSAAALWQMPGFDPGDIEIIVPRSRRPNGEGVVAHWLTLPRSQVTSRDSVPITRPFRTLVDIASVASPEVVEEALDDALRCRLVSIRQMRWFLDHNQGLKGIATIRGLVEARASGAPVPESVLETKLWRTLVRAGIQGGVRQYPVRQGGRVIAVVDVAFPRNRVAVEADGYRWHSGRSRWAKDLARRNALSSLGWQVLHVTWDDLIHRPDQVASVVAQALAEGPARKRSG